MFRKSDPTVTIFLGLLFLAVGGYNYKIINDCNDWPTVEGEVSSAEVKESRPIWRLFGGDLVSQYMVFRKYHYKVGTTDYPDKNTATDPERFATRELAEESKKITKIIVHYNPNDPKQKVVNRVEDGKNTVGLIFMSVGILAAGVEAMIIKRVKKECPNLIQIALVAINIFLACRIFITFFPT